MMILPFRCNYFFRALPTLLIRDIPFMYHLSFNASILNFHGNAFNGRFDRDFRDARALAKVDREIGDERSPRVRDVRLNIQATPTGENIMDRAIISVASQQLSRTLYLLSISNCTTWRKSSYHVFVQ